MAILGDAIGFRGEYLALVMLTRLGDRAEPFFRPYLLGEKAETLDLMVELLGAGDIRPFFFVQVKTTRRGYTLATGNRRRLRVSVPPRDMQRLTVRPVPTYIIGIDEQGEVGYILSAQQPGLRNVSSIPTRHPLHGETLEILWNEVRTYWADHARSPIRSAFV